jgi:ABC-2 type transport system ATP-binding protein
MAEHWIIAEGLHRRFGDVRAVNGVSLHIAAGEIYGLVGPDGAGKTTLVRLLCGALHPDAGEVSLAGYDMLRMPERGRERLGYLAQRFALYEDLTVQENLHFFAEVRGLPAAQWRARSRELLEFVGLAQFLDRRAGQLSGGMKQKLGLAIALINQPQVLLLDEPTTGVDPGTRQDFWRLIIPLLAHGNLAVLVSTPYMDEAIRCTRVGFMRSGQIIREGPPHELRMLLAGQVLELAGDSRPRLTELAAADAGVEAVQRFGKQLHLRVRPGQAEAVIARLRAVAEAEGLMVERLQMIEPQLEDVFIALAEPGVEQYISR